MGDMLRVIQFERDNPAYKKEWGHGDLTVDPAFQFHPVEQQEAARKVMSELRYIANGAWPLLDALRSGKSPPLPQDCRLGVGVNPADLD